MLYEFNQKIYIKPFSNKLIEVEIAKSGKGYDVKPTKKTVVLNAENKGKIVQIPLEEAYKKARKTINVI